MAGILARGVAAALLVVAGVTALRHRLTGRIPAALFVGLPALLVTGAIVVAAAFQPLLPVLLDSQAISQLQADPGAPSTSAAREPGTRVQGRSTASVTTGSRDLLQAVPRNHHLRQHARGSRRGRSDGACRGRQHRHPQVGRQGSHRRGELSAVSCGAWRNQPSTRPRWSGGMRSATSGCAHLTAG